jgi:hypothetical protein
MAQQVGTVSPDGQWIWNGSQSVPNQQSTAPVQEVGRLSPDGRWMWNGVGWTPYSGAGRATPPGFTLFRGYAIVVALLLVGVGTLATIGNIVNGYSVIRLVEIGFVLMEGLLLGIAIFLPRKPWAWVWCLIAILLGLGGITILVAVPLLVYWLRGDTRRYYGMA